MQAYVISLYNRESKNNKTLADLLTENGFDVHFIDAVNGPSLDSKSYFLLIQKYFEHTRKLLTPSELGCTLSHKRVYEKILEAGVTSALVFEDDVILDDSDCDKIKKIINKNLSYEGFIHLGGQDGLDNNFKNLGGILINSEPKIFEVNPDDLCWLSRTVGYLISANIAEKILHLLNNHPVLIDDFSYISNNAKIPKFFFSDIVRHPIDLTKSTIETERVARFNFSDQSNLGLLQRLRNEVAKTINHRIKMLRKKKQTKYSKIKDFLY